MSYRGLLAQDALQTALAAIGTASGDPWYMTVAPLVTRRVTGADTVESSPCIIIGPVRESARFAALTGGNGVYHVTATTRVTCWDDAPASALHTHAFGIGGDLFLALRDWTLGGVVLDMRIMAVDYMIDDAHAPRVGVAADVEMEYRFHSSDPSTGV